MGTAAITAEARPERSPRRWLRRLLLGVNIFLAACLVAAGTAYGYIKWRYGQIDKLSFENGVLRIKEADDPPGLPMNVLVVGSDTRAVIGKDEQRKFGSEAQTGGQRSDTMMILHVDPKSTKAAMMSIPRDLWVNIPGMGKQRINTAFQDGPALLIKTITNELGIKIDHYVEIDFNGFRGLVNAVGGVPMYLSGPVRDSYSGLNVKQGGCVTLDGEQALGWVRARHFQYMENGRWHGDPTGDLGRMQRQQEFLRRLMRRAISRGARNPITLNSMVSTGVDNVKIDSGFSQDLMVELGKRFRNLEPEAVESFVLPVVDANVGGAAVLLLDKTKAQPIIDKFNGIPPPGATAGAPQVIPSSVSIRVLNGSGKGGAAGSAAATLRKLQFNVVETGDADSFKYQRSVLRYAKGQEAKARFLATYLPESPKLELDASLQGVDVAMVLGLNYAGLRAPAGQSSPATTPTTQAPASPGAKPTGEAPPQPACG